MAGLSALEGRFETITVSVGDESPHTEGCDESQQSMGLSRLGQLITESTFCVLRK
jgi:hypothetical protein